MDCDREELEVTKELQNAELPKEEVVNLLKDIQEIKDCLNNINAVSTDKHIRNKSQQKVNQAFNKLCILEIKIKKKFQILK